MLPDISKCGGPKLGIIVDKSILKVDVIADRPELS